MIADALWQELEERSQRARPRGRQEAPCQKAPDPAESQVREHLGELGIVRTWCRQLRLIELAPPTTLQSASDMAKLERRRRPARHDIEAVHKPISHLAGSYIVTVPKLLAARARHAERVDGSCARPLF